MLTQARLILMLVVFLFLGFLPALTGARAEPKSGEHDHKCAGYFIARAMAIQKKAGIIIHEPLTADGYFEFLSNHPALTPELKEQLEAFRALRQDPAFGAHYSRDSFSPLAPVRISDADNVRYFTTVELLRELSLLAGADPSAHGNRRNIKNVRGIMSSGQADLFDKANSGVKWEKSFATRDKYLEAMVQELSERRPELIPFIEGFSVEKLLGELKVSKRTAASLAPRLSPQYAPGAFVPARPDGAAGSFYYSGRLEATTPEEVIETVLNQGVFAPGAVARPTVSLATLVASSRELGELTLPLRAKAPANPFQGDTDTLVLLNSNRAVPAGDDSSAAALPVVLNPREIRQVSWKAPDNDTFKFRFLWSSGHDVLEVEILSEKGKSFDRRYYAFNPALHRYEFLVRDEVGLHEILPWPELEELGHRLYWAKKSKLELQVRSGDHRLAGTIQAVRPDELTMKVVDGHGGHLETLRLESIHQRSLLEELRRLTSTPENEKALHEMAEIFRDKTLAEVRLVLRGGKELRLDDYQFVPAHADSPDAILAHLSDDLVAIPLLSLDAGKTLPLLRRAVAVVPASGAARAATPVEQAITADDARRIALVRKLKKRTFEDEPVMLIPADAALEPIVIPAGRLSLSGRRIVLAAREGVRALDVRALNYEATKKALEETLARRTGRAKPVTYPLIDELRPKLFAFRRGGLGGIAQVLEWYEAYTNEADQVVPVSKLLRDLTVLNTYKPGERSGVDVKPVRSSTSLLELRVKGRAGGLRIYFTVGSNGSIVLLHAGYKSDQDKVSSGGDIGQAVSALEEYQRIEKLGDRVRDEHLVQGLEQD